MHIFTDKRDRQWQIVLDFATVKQIRDSVGINLLSEDLGATLTAMEDVINLVDAIFVSVKSQADERGVSDEEFGRSLDGDTIENATTAFLKELVDFFPRGRRLIMDKVVQKITQNRATALVDLEKALADLDSGETPTVLPGLSE